MLIDAPPSRILGRWVPEPLPTAGTFDGYVVLVTGATAGLGLAAAIHFARLGAEVIITYRNAHRAYTAQRKIEEYAKSAGSCKVSALELDMSQYDTCVAFVDSLKKSRAGKPGLDIAVLNAGTINSELVNSPEGWEETIQVNALSTTLLGLLLLDWMKEGRASQSRIPRLVFVTSRDHLYPDITHWAEWSKSEGLLNHFSNPKNWPNKWATTEPNYANSKLLVMYAIEEICKQALDADGKPRVAINSVCPGLVHTEIARTISARSWMMKVVVAVYLTVLGKTTDHGARFYVTSAMRPEADHGKFRIAWLTDEQYLRKAAVNITSERGRMVQALVWKEIINELTSKVPSLRKTSLNL